VRPSESKPNRIKHARDSRVFTGQGGSFGLLNGLGGGAGEGTRETAADDANLRCLDVLDDTLRDDRLTGDAGRFVTGRR
jgi:hypothetical protein